MNQKIEDEITNEFLEIIENHTVKPEPADKRKPYLTKIILMSIIGILICMLSFSYDPAPKVAKNQKTPIYYPIEKPPIEINIKAASADDLPKIRIGSGCSFFKSRSRSPEKDLTQNI